MLRGSRRCPVRSGPQSYVRGGRGSTVRALDMSVRALQVRLVVRDFHWGLRGATATRKELYADRLLSAHSPSGYPGLESVSSTAGSIRTTAQTHSSDDRLEVLKVRLQTSRVPSSRVGGGSRSASVSPATPVPPSPASASVPTSLLKSASSLSASASTSRLPASIPIVVPSASVHSHSQAQARPGLRALWRAEGAKFLFAGAAGPILGLAFIDSAFFGGYGFFM